MFDIESTKKMPVFDSGENEVSPWVVPDRVFGRPNGLIEGRDFNLALEILSDITV